MEKKEFNKLLDERIKEHLEPINIDILYDEMLDDCYPETNVCGYKYNPSYALKELDPTAYRCGLNDFSSDYYELNGCYYNQDDVDNLTYELEQEIEDQEASKE